MKIATRYTIEKVAEELQLAGFQVTEDDVWRIQNFAGMDLNSIKNWDEKIF
jgi:hypothetical protein